MKRLVIFIMTLIFMPIQLIHADQSLTKPIRMAYLQSDIHHLACWVAIEQGLYQKQGVQVSIAGVFKAGPEIMTAFSARELDMAYVGEAPATTAAANKAAKVVAVAQVNTEGSAVVTAKNKEIATIADLKGKIIAIPGHSTVQDFLMRKLLNQSQLAPKDVTIMVIKPPEMIPALQTGQIDAFIAWEPYPSKAVTSDAGRYLASSNAIWEGHPCCVLVSDAEFYNSHSEQVKAVVAAHVQATDFIRQYPEQAVQIGVTYTGMDEKTIRQAMKTVHYTCRLSIEGEKEYVRFLSELNYIRVSEVDAFVEQFIKPDLLNSILSQ